MSSSLYQSKPSWRLMRTRFWLARRAILLMPSNTIAWLGRWRSTAGDLE